MVEIEEFKLVSQTSGDHFKRKDYPLMELVRIPGMLEKERLTGLGVLSLIGLLLLRLMVTVISILR